MIYWIDQRSPHNKFNGSLLLGCALYKICDYKKWHTEVHSLKLGQFIKNRFFFLNSFFERCKQVRINVLVVGLSMCFFKSLFQNVALNLKKSQDQTLSSCNYILDKMFSTEKEMISTLSVILGVIWFQGRIPKSAVKLLSQSKFSYERKRGVMKKQSLNTEGRRNRLMNMNFEYFWFLVSDEWKILISICQICERNSKAFVDRMHQWL